ncbi:MAG: DinB family protein [Acidobacteria bacterium]|nr:DinB family protein [Acidobacteriota bacterium]
MDDRTRKSLIDRYKDGYRAVAEALAGIDPSALDRHPAPGKWSPREIVHHLADSEMASAIRLRMLLAEERPQIHGYDQEEYARKLHYDRPYEKSLEAFRYARETTAEILERMGAEEWAREGTHSEHGRYTVERWLQIYAEHAHKHAEQIRRARAVAAR